MTITAAVALGFQEFYAAFGFFTAAGMTAGVGGLANRGFSDAPAPRETRQVIAAGGWLLVAAFGSLPFLLTAWFTPPAVMDTFVPVERTRVRGRRSGSAERRRFPVSVLPESAPRPVREHERVDRQRVDDGRHEPSLPRAIQWWRSLIQWVGGVGVIVLTVSILARPGSGSYALYRSKRVRRRSIQASSLPSERSGNSLSATQSFRSRCCSVLSSPATASTRSRCRCGRSPGWLSAMPYWLHDSRVLGHETRCGVRLAASRDRPAADYDSRGDRVPGPLRRLARQAGSVNWCGLADPWLFIRLTVGVVGLSVQNAWSVPATTEAFATQSFLPVSVPMLNAAQLDAVRDSTFQWISALSCTGFQSAPIGSGRQAGNSSSRVRWSSAVRQGPPSAASKSSARTRSVVESRGSSVACSCPQTR